MTNPGLIPTGPTAPSPFTAYGTARMGRTPVVTSESPLQVSWLDPKPAPLSAQLRRWRLALAKVRAGTGYQATIAFCGDSTTAGNSSGATDLLGGCYPAIASRLLAAGGIPIANGWARVSATAPTPADSRVTHSGWPTTGGGSSTTNGDFISYSPGFVTDRLDIIYEVSTAFRGGTFTVDVGGGVLATVVTTAASANTLKTTVTAPRALNTWKITHTDTSVCVLDFLRAWDSTSTGAVHCLNYGAPGQSSGYFYIGAQWGPQIQASLLAPDLTFFMQGANDTGTNVENSLSAAKLAISTWKTNSGGDIVITTAPPSTDPGHQPWMNRLNAAYPKFAADNGWAFLDIYDGCGPSTAAGYGLFTGDGLHPNQNGNAEIARAAAQWILAN